MYSQKIRTGTILLVVGILFGRPLNVVIGYTMIDTTDSNSMLETLPRTLEVLKFTNSLAMILIVVGGAVSIYGYCERSYHKGLARKYRQGTSGNRR